MLSEYKDIVEQLKLKDTYFAAIIEKHKQLNEKIRNVKEGKEYMEDLELEELKKEKLTLKDQAYAAVIRYKQENKL